MTLSSVSSTLIAAFQYVPYVTGAVQAVESTNAGLPGETKKQLVLASITAAAKVGETVPEAHVALISALIDTLVSILNACGLFGHAKAAAVAVPAAVAVKP